ncbi:MAG: primosomal protein N' [Kiritimatiellae bacterium]|nr:primosomal protein N' [Kiritimatiellia bacterium]
MIVKVAIDLALDRLFDYEVPETLREKLAVGQLLSVPFGHRTARGFAMGVRDGGESGEAAPAKLKEVEAIVDETPFFSASLLDLAGRVAKYTSSPIESVLRAAVPAAVVRKGARAKESLFVEPAVGGGEAPTERLRWLHEQVVRLGGGWLAGLCAELRTTPSSLRRLESLGLVTICARARRRDPLAAKRVLPTSPLPLNAGQAAALRAIAGGGEAGEGADKRPLLLFGVTGSGKTEVYLQAIAAELQAGRGAIVMVPEIALTPQTVQRFASRFGNKVAVLHSALSDGERYDEWHRIRSGEARVVVGPRSAVWAPVRSLGLIVVDEEHETSYKQDETPRYNARDVAVLRGAIEGARVVLGSATPSLESWLNAKRGKYAVTAMPSRAGAGTTPTVHLVDMTAEAGSEGRGGAIFSKELLDAIALRLSRHEQTILFLNRRGYSRQMTCERCGHVFECPECSTPDRGMPYTYHRADSCLRCHVCGGWTELPRKCPTCGSTRLAYRGIGTQRAEAALKTCFPEATILRMDADSTSRKNSHDDILSSFRRGEADVLVGTQMIAKGLDFPNVTLVGVLNADSSLNMPDFRAAERTFQLIAQVSGRAGRAELPGEVFVQTHDPENSVLRFAARADYEKFAESELRERMEGGFPPFCRLSVATFKSKDLRLVGGWATMYAESLRRYAEKMKREGGPGRALLVSEAMPSAVEKADGWFRWQIVLRAPSNSSIAAAWRWIVAMRPPPRELRTALDADAVNLV